jgi:hypothetical protein
VAVKPNMLTSNSLAVPSLRHGRLSIDICAPDDHRQSSGHPRAGAREVRTGVDVQVRPSSAVAVSGTVTVRMDHQNVPVRLMPWRRRISSPLEVAASGTDSQERSSSSGPAR